MVMEKERLLRNRKLNDIFVGMKAHENKAGNTAMRVSARLSQHILSWDDTYNRRRSTRPLTPSLPLPSLSQVVLTLYCEVAASLDAISGGPNAVLLAVLEVALAGNLFDAGAAAAVQNIAFCDDSNCDVPDSEQKRYSVADERAP